MSTTRFMAFILRLEKNIATRMAARIMPKISSRMLVIVMIDPAKNGGCGLGGDHASGSAGHNGYQVFLLFIAYGQIVYSLFFGGKRFKQQIDLLVIPVFAGTLTDQPFSVFAYQKANRMIICQIHA